MRRGFLALLIVSLISCTGTTPAFAGDGVHFSLQEAQQCVRDGKAARLLESPPTALVVAPGGFTVEGLHVVSDPDDPIKLRFGWGEELFYPVTIHPGIDVMAVEPAPSWWDENKFLIGVLTPFILGGLAYGAAK